MNYFFVFQNLTFHEEFRGEYLWAPKYGKSGKKVSHWEKMKKVRRGDIIIHSYKKQILAISIAKRDVYSAKKPAELSGEWQQEGWRVDTTYISFSKPIITSDYKKELLDLQPQIDAPFNRLGKGNTGYLFDANESMYDFIITQTLARQNSEQDKNRIIEHIKLKKKDQKTISELEILMDLEEAKAKELTPERLATQIKNEKPGKSQKTEFIVYYRSPYIKKMVKQIADGKCQMCGENAPFLDKDKAPYLEEHHVDRLADGGSDTMDNVVAICPNCHRKIHVLNNQEDGIILKEIAMQNYQQFRRLLAYTERLSE